MSIIYNPTSVPLRIPFAHYKGYNFIKPIRIIGVDKKLTDYQVKIELNSTNFPFEKCRTDGYDIRFVDDDGQPIDYWLESWYKSSKTAILWSKIPEIPSRIDKMIWMVYGNLTASSASDIDDAFLFGDIFNSGSSLDTNKWDTVGTILVDGGYCKLNPSETEKIFAKSSYWYGENYSLRWRADVRDDGGTIDQRSMGWMDTDRAWNYYQIQVPRSDLDSWRNTASCLDNNAHTFTSGFKTYEISRAGPQTHLRFFENDVQTSEETTAACIAIVNLMPYFYVYIDDTDQLWIDWVLVRKYNFPEPQVIVL